MERGKTMGNQLPSRQTFAVRNLADLAKLPIAKGEWIGVYRHAEGGEELVRASRSPRALARSLKRESLFWPALFRCASSKAALPVKIEEDKPDHFDSLQGRAWEAVAYARNIRRNSRGWHSEAEVKRAETFLRELSNTCRSEGKPRGDKPTEEENRRMLDVFLRLANGEELKAIAIDIGGPDKYEKKLGSLDVRTKRFSKRVYAALRSRYVVVAPGLLGPRSPMYLSGLFASVEKWPGVRFNSSDDGRALREALRRYKPGKSDQAEVTHRFWAAQVPL
jgi:hypothetical protein